MKKLVVLKQKNDVIDLSQITDKSIVGIEWESSSKSFIIQIKSNRYAGTGSIDLSVNGVWETETKMDYIEKAITQQNADCFVFNTLKELYEWLAED
jgi:hypothetical protein